MIKQSDGWWFTFFNNPDYLDIYGNTVNEDRTVRELHFCDRALEWTPGNIVLDGPCGQGRHTRKLHQRGFRVIGMDLSPYLLGVASGPEEEKAANTGPTWVRAHLGHLPLCEGSVDYAISMFSSFGYGVSEEENLGVMCEYARVLRPGGSLLIDVMNRHYIARYLTPVYRHRERGLAVREERKIIESGRRLHNKICVTDREGVARRYDYKPWLFNGFELTLLAECAGLRPKKVYGSFESADYNLDSERAMLVAVKP